MATFVLVHGGGHGGWCWQRLAPLLRAAGHDVYTPTLTGLGERSHLLHPDINLDTHIADVTGVLCYEDLADVILVGHSYGGMVITGVADRATSRLGQLVYLDAAIPNDGESLVDVAPQMMKLARGDARVVNGVELVLWPVPDMGQFYGVTDPAEVAWMQDKLTPHPWACFEQPLHVADDAAIKRIPRTNINTTASLRGSEPDRRQRQLAADRAWEIDTGHDLMITEPVAVADMLLRLAPPERGSGSL
jgi:pimeloyl-ACP methyl ester carboxylesterase